MRTKNPVREDGSVRVSYTFDNDWSESHPQSRGQFVCATLSEFHDFMKALKGYMDKGKPTYFAGENGILVFSKRLIEVSRV